MKLINKLLAPSLVVILLIVGVQITKAQSLTFKQAINRGLENNSQIIEQRKEIEGKKRKLVKVKVEQGWQWTTEFEPRLVSKGTNISARKDLVALIGERTFWPGLTLEPELYVKEKEVRNEGWQQAEVYFKLETEQLLYPFIASKPRQDYQEAKLALKIAEAELKELKRSKLVDWLEDYLELIELKQKKELEIAEYNFAQQELAEVKEKYHTGQADKEALLEIKIDANEAAQARQEIKTDYSEKLDELQRELAVGEKEELKVPADKDFFLRWEQKLNSQLPELSNSEQLIKAAKANSSELAILQWERQQVKRELKQQKVEEKPELTLGAEYDTEDQAWEVGFNFSHDLFNRREAKLAREELKEDLAEVERKTNSYLQDLSSKVKSIVKSIHITKLKVREQKLRLEEATLELTKISRTSAPLDHKEQKLDVKAAKLKLQEIQHKLLVDKYELAQLFAPDLKNN